ncbi:hypothetical protein L7F22_052558 [Adiantum nelumboides]|nr:hypothetical protein [Adiantum nelumboides]
MKNLGELCYFLGIEMIRNEGGIWLSQKKYGLDILMKYGMADSKLTSTPLDQNLKLRIDEGEVLDDVTMYRKIMGSFIYMTTSQPNLSYAIGLAQYVVLLCTFKEQLQQHVRVHSNRAVSIHVNSAAQQVQNQEAPCCLLAGSLCRAALHV